MRDIIAAGLADLGLLDRVPGQAPSQLAEYGHLLLEKNQVMNLTAITDPVKVEIGRASCRERVFPLV